MIETAKSILNDPEQALGREWLVTNGIGGYASSTVVGANTRHYHGLLVASFPPPVERQVLLAKVDEELDIGGETFLLGANEYHDGTIHPEGYHHLKSFRLEAGIPAFEYRANGATLLKQVWMEHGRNTVYVLYRLLDVPHEARLTIRPFCAFRCYHGDGQREGIKYTAALSGDRRWVSVESQDAPYTLRLAIPGDGSFICEEDWYRRFLYRVERERGFEHLEDLYTPGEFVVYLRPGEECALIATCERELPDLDFNAAFAREMSRCGTLAGEETDPLRRQLLLAADQFVVCSPSICSPRGRGKRSRKCIVAGYHWFTDWGRDTMIGLPGLLLSTGRFDEARDILLEHEKHIEGGIVPNRFSDTGEAEYNAADASMWYFEAVNKYAAASGDREIIRKLFPSLRRIIRSYTEGTEFGIRIDGMDGLLWAGEPDSQITWMDACVEGCPVTPRIGKPVEINALWFNALSLMASWSRELGGSALPYEAAAEKCIAGFERFWYGDGGYLMDVLDGPAGDDRSLRPNQILAVSLPYSPLSPERQKQVVDVVERALLTPYGLRTLSVEDPAYVGKYRGGPAERDCAYHQGTVWPWLLGHFADAHFRVYRDRGRIADLLQPFSRHISEAGVGSISEIFDGDPPQLPGGCIAQAWSVGEILRIYDMLRE